MILSIVLFSSCLASFFSVIAERVPIGLSIISPCSHCPMCKNKLKSSELIPIISYLFLKGKCRYCQAKIPLSSIGLELLLPLLFLIFHEIKILDLPHLPGIIIICTSLILSLTDILYFIISPTIFFTGYGLSLLLYSLPYYHCHFHLSHSVLLYLLFYILFYLPNKQIGLGDIKIISFWALTLSLTNLIHLILYASLSALSYALYLKNIRGLSLKSKQIPFAPFLTLGYIIIFIQ